MTANIELMAGDTLRKPRRIAQYNDYGVLTNFTAGGTLGREVAPSGVVTRIVKSTGEVSMQKFVPSTK